MGAVEVGETNNLSIKGPTRESKWQRGPDRSPRRLHIKKLHNIISTILLICLGVVPAWQLLGAATSTQEGR